MFRTFDHQKGCLDSEIFDAGSINAPLVGEDFYRRRNLTRVTDEPEVIPGKKSPWRKRGVRTRGVGPDLLEARFWSEAHVQEADLPSKWTRAGDSTSAIPSQWRNG
jgi:hypothetical protein